MLPRDNLDHVDLTNVQMDEEEERVRDTVEAFDVVVGNKHCLLIISSWECHSMFLTPYNLGISLFFMLFRCLLSLSIISLLLGREILFGRSYKDWKC